MLRKFIITFFVLVILFTSLTFPYKEANAIAPIVTGAVRVGGGIGAEEVAERVIFSVIEGNGYESGKSEAEKKLMRDKLNQYMEDAKNGVNLTQEERDLYWQQEMREWANRNENPMPNTVKGKKELIEETNKRVADAPERGQGWKKATLKGLEVLALTSLFVGAMDTWRDAKARGEWDAVESEHIESGKKYETLPYAQVVKMLETDYRYGLTERNYLIRKGHILPWFPRYESGAGTDTTTSDFRKKYGYLPEQIDVGHSGVPGTITYYFVPNFYDDYVNHDVFVKQNFIENNFLMFTQFWSKLSISHEDLQTYLDKENPTELVDPKEVGGGAILEQPNNTVDTSPYILPDTGRPVHLPTPEKFYERVPEFPDEYTFYFPDPEFFPDPYAPDYPNPDTWNPHDPMSPGSPEYPDPVPDPNPDPVPDPNPDPNPDFPDAPDYGKPEGINWGKLKNVPAVITTKFPFSLPWDVFYMAGLLDAEPERIKIDGNFTVAGMDIPVKIEVSDKWDGLATFVRWGAFIMFAISLIYATRTLLGGSV